MSEPDDVERLVEQVETVYGPRGSKGLLRLARIVRELLARHPVRECRRKETLSDRVAACSDARPDDDETWCRACEDRALRERLCRIARGEEA